MLGFSAYRSPDFWEHPWGWLMHGRMEGAIALALLIGAALIELRRYSLHVAHRRATTPDGPDADFREPA
jgi:hypothetical protein